MLKEINSLLRLIDEQKELIKNESSRLSKIESLRQTRNEELDEVNSKISVLEVRTKDIEKELEALIKNKEQFERAVNEAKTQAALESSEKQFEFTLLNMNTLEEEQFGILEELEELSSLQKDAQEFLSGSLETLNEITSEVNELNAPRLSEISSLNNRISLIKEELPPLFQTKLESLLKKNLPLSPFTRIISHRCEYCKFQLSRVDEEAVEKTFALKNCSSCSRLFLPLDAAY